MHAMNIPYFSLNGVSKSEAFLTYLNGVCVRTVMLMGRCVCSVCCSLNIGLCLNVNERERVYTV